MTERSVPDPKLRSPSKISEFLLLKSFEGHIKKHEAHHLTVVKTPTLKALREEPMPPWLEDIRLIPKGACKEVYPNITDFWSHKQRYSAMKKFLPHTSKSKVKSIFRKSEHEEKKQKIEKKLNGIFHENSFRIRRLKLTRSDPKLDIGELHSDRLKKSDSGANRIRMQSPDPENLLRKARSIH